MKYKQFLICYALKFGVARAAHKYNRCRSYIYRWLNRYDGTIESLACHSAARIPILTSIRRKNFPSTMWCCPRKEYMAFLSSKIVKYFQDPKRMLNFNNNNIKLIEVYLDNFRIDS